MENNIKNQSFLKKIVSYRQITAAMMLMLSGVVMIMMLEIHIAAILKMSRYSIIAFYLFCMIMLGAVSIFNGFTLRKNNTLAMYIVSAFMTLLMIILTITYITLIIKNTLEDPAIIMDSDKVTSMVSLGVCSTFNLLGTIILGTCIDFHPVKES